MNDNNKLLMKLLSLLDEAFDLISRYDDIPLLYSDTLLYQAETHTIQLIGKNPGITVSDIAERMNKTKSASSQIIKKLRHKGAVIQKRNPENNRQYNLELTDYGWCIYWEHEKLDNSCYNNYELILSDVTQEQIEAAIFVQEKLNKAFRQDVEQSLRQSKSI